MRNVGVSVLYWLPPRASNKDQPHGKQVDMISVLRKSSSRRVWCCGFNFSPVEIIFVAPWLDRAGIGMVRHDDASVVSILFVDLLLCEYSDGSCGRAMVHCGDGAAQ